MRVPGARLRGRQPAPDDPALQQVANVAHLPGIVRLLAGHARHPLGLWLPHRRRGRGGRRRGRRLARAASATTSTAACGWSPPRLADEVRPRASTRVIAQLYRDIPTGVGASRRHPAPLRRGARRGALAGRALGGRGAASPRRRTTWSAARRAGGSPAPTRRGLGAGPGARAPTSSGTLGSGNHFLEVDAVAEVFDEPAAPRPSASARARSPCRSTPARAASATRSATSPWPSWRRAMAAIGPDYAQLPDRQLACAPVRSAGGAALPRRHAGGRQLRLGQPAGHDRARRPRAAPRAPASPSATSAPACVYDVCHNVAKHEEHEVDGRPPPRPRPPQGGDARLRPRRPARPRRLPGGRPAGAHPRRHGALLLRPGRDRRGPCATPSAAPATAPAACSPAHEALRRGPRPLHRTGSSPPGASR